MQCKIVEEDAWRHDDAAKVCNDALQPRRPRAAAFAHGEAKSVAADAMPDISRKK